MLAVLAQATALNWGRCTFTVPTFLVEFENIFSIRVDLDNSTDAHPVEFPLDTAEDAHPVEFSLSLTAEDARLWSLMDSTRAEDARPVEFSEMSSCLSS